MGEDARDGVHACLCRSEAHPGNGGQASKARPLLSGFGVQVPDGAPRCRSEPSGVLALPTRPARPSGQDPTRTCCFRQDPVDALKVVRPHAGCRGELGERRTRAALGITIDSVRPPMSGRRATRRGAPPGRRSRSARVRRSARLQARFRPSTVPSACRARIPTRHSAGGPARSRRTRLPARSDPVHGVLVGIGEGLGAHRTSAVVIADDRLQRVERAGMSFLGTSRPLRP